ncbi:MAG: GNAT family N-acetyltransferase [Patescibacteria group bacterium]
MTDERTGNHSIDRVMTAEELNEAFNKGLIELYQAVFADPPYEEKFTPEEVKDVLQLYFMQGVLMLCREDAQSVIGFSASVPLVLEQEIATIAQNFDIDPETVWYFADLGVSKEHRRKKIAQSLVVALLGETPVDTLLMRTSENNIASQRVNQSVGFEIIDGMEQHVQQTRQNGEVESDRRIFLKKQKSVVQS